MAGDLHARQRERPGIDIAEPLSRQHEVKGQYRLQIATDGYIEFLRLGGRLPLAHLSQYLVLGLLRRGLPILTGLSATYLYRTAREYGPEDVVDDIRGYPSGHFVVIADYDRARRRVCVVDPYEPNPYGSAHDYWLSIDRVVAAVLLGIVTHDANLLVIYPRSDPLPATLMSILFVVDQASEITEEYQGTAIVGARSYSTDPAYDERLTAKVVNLCDRKR